MRIGEDSRRTSETDITVRINLDGQGETDVETGVGFLDHMLDCFAVFGSFDLMVRAEGDLETGDHHTVEDVAIVLGMALSKALEDKSNIERLGYAIVPMDESMATVSLDLCDRAYYVSEFEFEGDNIGNLMTENIDHFFHTLAYNSCTTLHIYARGGNDHHKAATIFKAAGRALGEATKVNEDSVLGQQETL